MKKFKVTMLATSIKEIFIQAKDKKEALSKIDKAYLEDESFDFVDNDVVKIKRSCKEIISKRNEKFNAKGYDLPTDYGVEFINDVMDTFLKANKEVIKGGFLNVQLTKEDITRLEDLYNKYKEDVNPYNYN